MKKVFLYFCFFISFFLCLPVSAEQTIFDKWKCRLCPSIDGLYGNLSLGFDYTNEDNLRFISYRGVNDDGYFLSIGGDVHYRNKQGGYFNLYAENFGRDNGQFEIDTGKQGSYQLRFGVNDITRYRGVNSQSPFLGVGTDNLSLPENWVSATSTQEFSELAASLQEVPLKTRRRIFDAGLTFVINNNWQYQVDYQNQRKKGSRPFSGGLFLFNTSNFVAPVDFNTDQIDMRLSWTGKRSHIQFAAFGSWFDNTYRSITWQNPFLFDNDTQTLRSSLEPDNNYYQFSIKGAIVISPKLRASAQLSLGRAEQNDSFLPYSINPSFDNLNLPRSSLNAQLNTSNFNLSGKITARASRKLTLNARVKVNERDNKTPIDLYSPVLTDLFLPGDRFNRPYSYDKRQYNVDMRYKVHRNVTLNAGFKYEDFDRTLQEITNSKENTWWTEASMVPSVNSVLRIKYEKADRDVSVYEQQNDGGPIDHPLLRKFNQADRIRQRTQIQFDVNPTSQFGINFSYYYADDDYRQSPLGLQGSDEQSYNIDVNYAIHENTQINVFYSHVSIDALLTNAISVNDTPWVGMTEDRIESSGIGIVTELKKNARFGIDFIASDSLGGINVRTDLNEAPFSDLLTNLKNIRLYFDYQVNKHWSYRIDVQYEKFNSSDFALDDIGADSIDEVLLFGTQAPNYDAWLVSFRANYHF